jgi:AraC-like DNA-binding protein
MTRETTEDKNRIRTARKELIGRITRALPEDGWTEPFPNLFLTRTSKISEALNTVHQPAFCFLVQGSKRALLGEEIFRYDPDHYMIYTVELPLVFEIDDATPDRPCLGVRMNLDPVLVGSVMMESGVKIKKGDASSKAMDVRGVDADLVEAVLRLVRLADSPREQKVLTPLITREIVFRLLEGGQAERLAHLLSSGDTQRISKAIARLRERFDEPMDFEGIARELGMSTSGFYHHFKSVTAMSPLQFLKQIRLQEARRLMLGENLDAATAGFRVGYESPAYFNRDYKKQFGDPPQRDIARLRRNAEVTV